VGVTFALVHGAWHGAWCWERVLAPLREHGHDAVAIDLPCDDPDAGLDGCADTIVEALAGVDGDVVLVAHSLGGLTAPRVAARRPLQAVVHVAALVPIPGRSIVDEFAASPEPVLLFDGGRATDEQERTHWTDVETTARVMYPDLSDADVRWAFARLRPQAARPALDPQPAALPAVRTASLVCAEDCVVNPAWSRRVAREHLGVEPIELAAGHFPMITAPQALADALAAQADG
jgi:pimeloyl-ACP methyl ester carboxylesterase